MEKKSGNQFTDNQPINNQAQTQTMVIHQHINQPRTVTMINNQPTSQLQLDSWSWFVSFWKVGRRYDIEGWLTHHKALVLTALCMVELSEDTSQLHVRMMS